MWSWLKQLWESKKSILVSWLMVKLDELELPLADKLKDLEGTPSEQAKKIIEFVKEYIKRQL